MDLKVKRVNWIGSIYHKFEAVFQEVDDIVGQDAVKYLENQVQNVGDSMKKFYSGVQDLLPLPAMANSAEYDAHSVPSKNNIDSSVTAKEVADVKYEDNNRKGDEENPVDNFIESLQDSNAIGRASDHQALASTGHDPVNQVNYGSVANSLDLEDSCLTMDEVGNDHLEETSCAMEENFHPSIEKTVVQCASLPMNLISFIKKEPLHVSILSESCSASAEIGFGISAREKHDLGLNFKQNYCSSVENRTMNSSTSEVVNIKSLDEKEPSEDCLLSGLSDCFDQNTDDVLAVVLSSATSCERPAPSLFSDSQYSKSLGSDSSEIESCKNNSVDISWSVSDSSMVHLCCELSPPVASQIMEPQDEHVSIGCSQAMGSNDESLVNDVLEDIQLNDDAKLGKNCVFVDDRELHAVSCRTGKLRSYKKRIQDAFASKKRLAKEYEQLSIWYGDADMESSQDSSPILLPFTSRIFVESKNMWGQHGSDTEWELV